MLKSSIRRLFRHIIAEVGDFFLLFEKLFESYKITVCSEIRSYTNTERTQAPQDSNQYFELEG